MHSPGQRFIVFALLAIIIGGGLYLHEKHGRLAVQPPSPHEIASQHTNHPSIRPHHSQPAGPETSDSSGLSVIPKEKVDEYLERHHRDAASLLAAFHALGDSAYLNEAATNFPNDPHLQWTALMHNDLPKDRRLWLDRFKTSSPSNSLANYLSAEEYFKNGQPDVAMKEIAAASAKSQFTDYSMETMLNGEALGQFSGSSPLETRVTSMAAMSEDLMPELGNLRGIANSIKELQQQYTTSGDTRSVQNLAQAGLDLANHLMTGDGGKFVLNQFVGMASEKTVLSSLDQNTSYDFLNGETPAQRAADLTQQRVAINDLQKNLSAVFFNLSEDQMNDYWNRVEIYGEVEAMRWLKQQPVVTPNSGN